MDAKIEQLPVKPKINIPYVEIDEMYDTVAKHSQLGTMDVSEVRNMLHIFEAKLWTRFAEEMR
jgi:hypothetical protein